MIKYNLKCIECGYTYDSWFSSSKDFDKVKKLDLLNCNKCNSLKVEKSLMAPNLKNTTKKNNNLSKNKLIKRKIKSYQEFIKKNFKYVGDNFPYEARSIHYDNKNSKKGIYGIATNKEVKELKEEGINTHVVPWIEDKDN